MKFLKKNLIFGIFLLVASQQLFSMENKPIYDADKTAALKHYLNGLVRSTYYENQKEIQALTQFVSQCVQQGADPNIPNDINGTIAVHFAAEAGLTELIKFLVRYGSNINAKNTTNGSTPLFYAANNGHKESIELLIGLGADIESRNKNGDTPLIKVALNDYMEAAIQLIGCGASLDQENLISINARGKTKNLLKTYFPTSPAFFDEPQLHKAIRLKANSDELKRIMDESEPVLNQLDFFKQTPMDIALVSRNIEAIKLLLSYETDLLFRGLYNGIRLASRIPEWQNESDLEPSLYRQILSPYLRYYWLVFVVGEDKEAPREIIHLIVRIMLSMPSRLNSSQ